MPEEIAHSAGKICESWEARKSASFLIGEPTIIAGLLDNQETRTLTGLPGFANLPGGVGYLFGQRNATSQDIEMLIVITPYKLRLRDRVSRSIYAGHDTNIGRGSAPVPAPPQPQP